MNQWCTGCKLSAVCLSTDYITALRVQVTQRGGAMSTKIAHGEYPVNEQLDCSQVNSHNMYEIMGELKVRRRA